MRSARPPTRASAHASVISNSNDTTKAGAGGTDFETLSGRKGRSKRVSAKTFVDTGSVILTRSRARAEKRGSTHSAEVPVSDGITPPKRISADDPPTDDRIRRGTVLKIAPSKIHLLECECGYIVRSYKDGRLIDVDLFANTVSSSSKERQTTAWKALASALARKDTMLMDIRVVWDKYLSKAFSSLGDVNTMSFYQARVGGADHCSRPTSWTSRGTIAVAIPIAAVFSDSDIEGWLLSAAEGWNAAMTKPWKISVAIREDLVVDLTVQPQVNYMKWTFACGKTTQFFDLAPKPSELFIPEYDVLNEIDL